MANLIECIKCHHQFRLKTLAPDERRFRALYSEYKCPICETWLAPTAAYIVSFNLGAVLFSASAIGFLFKASMKADLWFWLLLTIAGIGLALLLISFITFKSEEIKPSDS